MQVVHEVHDRIMPLPLPCMMIMVMDAMRFDSKKMAASSSLQVKYVSKCFFHHPLASSRSRYAIEIRPGGCSCISDSDASQPLQKSTELLLLGSGFAAWHIQPLPLGIIGLLLWLGAAEENRAQGDDGLSILKWSWVSFGLQLFGHFLGQQHQFLVQAMVLGRIQSGLRLWCLFSRRLFCSRRISRTMLRIRRRRSQWWRTIPHQKSTLSNRPT